jgi:hypothetical protein
MSQDELASAIRAAGDRAGEPNGCTKRLVQKWEAGLVSAPRPVYVRALEAVTGQPIGNLGFESAEAKYGISRGEVVGMGAPSPLVAGKEDAGPLNGIWLSSYEFESSGRGKKYWNGHYVVLLQRGAKVQVRSLPKTTTGRVSLDLTVNGQVVTGTWTEETNAEGYYQGSVYYGALQMLLEPTGHRMSGKWVGFGRDFDVNVGPWTLELVTADTGTAAMEQYDRPVEGGLHQGT